MIRLLDGRDLIFYGAKWVSIMGREGLESPQLFETHAGRVDKLDAII